MRKRCNRFKKMFVCSLAENIRRIAVLVVATGSREVFAAAHQHWKIRKEHDRFPDLSLGMLLARCL